MPRFPEIPEAKEPRRAWFPVREAPVMRPGDDAFGAADAARTGGYVPSSGLVLGVCYQRIDPLTGELLDVVEEVLVVFRQLHQDQSATKDDHDFLFKMRLNEPLRRMCHR